MKNETKFISGQIWKYDNNSGEEDSVLTILKIDRIDNDSIIHVRIDNIKIPISSTGTYVDHIGHLPFSETQLSNSVTEMTGHAKELPSFSEGYMQWKNAFGAGKAGYWKMSVKEALEGICKVAKG